MRVVVLGGSGMIGHVVWRELSRRSVDVWATLRGRRDTSLGAGQFANCQVLENFDAATPEPALDLLSSLAPTVIVNCIGITKRKPEASDVRPMYAVNALFPHLLARWASHHGARVIHFSTDCVFAGESGRYTERSVMTATDLYGQTKFFGELNYGHCLTLRSSMIGRELHGRTELLEWFLSQEGKTIAGFTKAIYSGLTVMQMSRIVSSLIVDHPALSGVWQVAGPVISKYELLNQCREAFGVDILIRADDTFVCDRTLDAGPFAEITGITVPSWRHMLAELAADRFPYGT